MDSKLGWRRNSVALKGKPEVTFFPAEAPVLQHLWHLAANVSESVMAMSIFYAVVCLGIGLRGDRLNKLIHKVGRVLGMELDPMHVVVERMVLLKLLSTMDISHPLHSVMVSLKIMFSHRLNN